MESSLSSTRKPTARFNEEKLERKLSIDSSEPSRAVITMNMPARAGGSITVCVAKLTPYSVKNAEASTRSEPHKQGSMRGSAQAKLLFQPNAGHHAAQPNYRFLRLADVEIVCSGCGGTRSRLHTQQDRCRRETKRFPSGILYVLRQFWCNSQRCATSMKGSAAPSSLPAPIRELPTRKSVTGWCSCDGPCRSLRPRATTRSRLQL